METSPPIEEHFGLTETLRKQLLAYSTSSEIGKITAQAQSIEAVFDGLCLGFRDLAGYDRVMVLGIDSVNFCLKPLQSVGFDEEQLKDFCAEIDFMAGEYADAIFCNKHIFADPVQDSDAFSMLGCKAYMVFPLLKRVIDECWTAKNCQRTECSCYKSENLYCWTDLNAGRFANPASEDDRRRACVKCNQFKCEGLLWLDLTGRVDTITGEDTAMIYSAVTQAGLIIESFRSNEKLRETYNELRKAHSMLKADLQQASVIQQQLLPASFPKGFLDVFAKYLANLEVGGDYYDCFELNDDSIGLVIADVSGHGTAAAMLMSMFKIMLKSSPENGVSPALTLKNINNTLVTEIDSGKFITVFYAIWRKNTRELIYTNAGHNSMPLMNKKTGEIELLKSSGLFIGIMPDITVKDTVLKLDGEYRLNLYTDGINEAMNPAKDQFSHKRIYQLMQDTANGSCKDFVETLLKDVEVFCDGKELVDDVTILVCDL
ncbi:MAG: PP2C family protein-serine/threonine phosphatase [Fibromonadaceae bacterium]|jgi:serine phosphatase RsbU (regulator of sigma subunit)|nr:PP2C family protein-serine/threonine phosphatase [Fibromonadaceae bacterium]